MVWDKADERYEWSGGSDAVAVRSAWSREEGGFVKWREVHAMCYRLLSKFEANAMLLRISFVP